MAKAKTASSFRLKTFTKSFSEFLFGHLYFFGKFSAKRWKARNWNIWAHWLVFCCFNVASDFLLQCWELIQHGFYNLPANFFFITVVLHAALTPLNLILSQHTQYKSFSQNRILASNTKETSHRLSLSESKSCHADLHVFQTAVRNIISSGIRPLLVNTHYFLRKEKGFKAIRGWNFLSASG